MKKIVQSFFLLMLLTTMAWAQEKTVTGTVTAKDDGLPIPGASVKVKGTEQGTQTNGNGVFTLKVTGGNPVLVVSYIGYNVLEVSVKGTNINVVLTQNDKSLSEVVVTGYATKSKRAVTGSVSEVNVERSMSQPNASFDQMLQGQAAGINVKTGSGQPGRSADIVIRGKGSINGSTAPLYIIDGIELSGLDFSTLNQNDFETISVLKDASSTAIYGSRGANGVIVITTKKGKSGALRVSYDGQIGTSYLPKNQLEVMNTQEKLDFEQNIAGNPYNWSPAQFTELRKINTNWNDFVFRKGKTQAHNLSLSGGSDKTTFYSSLGYYDEEGVTIGTGIKKYNGRVNVTHTDKNIKIGANVSGGWSNYLGTTEGNQGVGSPLNTVLWALPYEKPYDEFGGYGTSIQFPFWINPIEDLKENRRGFNRLKGTGNVFMEYKLPWVENLTYKINMGGDYNQEEEFRLVKDGTQSALQNGDTSPFRGRGEIRNGLDRRFRYTITNSINYKTNLDADGNHTLSTSLYTEFLRNTGRRFNFVGYGNLVPLPNEAGFVAGTAQNGFIPTFNGSFPENSALMSYFGTADYAFKNKYYLSVTGRTDGSSKLSPQNRWTQYGSVGAGWVVTEEDFFKVKPINYLKFKVSYGAVGNQTGIGQFPYLQQYSRGTLVGQGTYAGQLGLNINRLGNANLTWEKRTTTNLGLDIEMFKSVVKASVEVYTSTTTNLYFNPFVPSTSGGNGTFLTNAGSMNNKGIEATLGVKVFNTKNFKWTVDANYAYNKNTILSLPDNQDLQLYFGNQALKVGAPFNSFYLVKFLGVNPENGSSQYLKADGVTVTEEYSAADRVVLGTSDAPHNAGLTSTWNFKGLELQVFGVLSTGNYIYNNARLNLENNLYTNSGYARSGLTAWTTPGQITNFPSLTEATEASTTRFLESGDFFRLRNVQLAYSLPKSITQKLKLQGFRVFVQGQNLYTKFKFQGWDPETSAANDDVDFLSSSVSGAQYPAMKRVTFGFNVTF